MENIFHIRRALTDSMPAIWSRDELENLGELMFWEDGVDVVTTTPHYMMQIYGGKINMQNLFLIRRARTPLEDSRALPTLSDSFPAIAVVGGQGSGKSSVLESIVGKDFLPRGSGFVTRRPLVLEKFTDFAAVRKEIQDETDRETGRSKEISSVPIHLSIYSPNVVNLTLIDLPGLTKVDVEGYSDESIVKDIENMVRSYIEKPNCIILAISPANQDFATSDAIKISGEVDPSGERTFGVLTKIDLMDKGTDAVEILEGRSFKLKYPLVGVVNRSQTDINKSVDITAARKREREYFFNTTEYRHLAHKMGSEHLVKMLSKHLEHVIKSRTPGNQSLITMGDKGQSNYMIEELETMNKDIQIEELEKQNKSITFVDNREHQMKTEEEEDEKQESRRSDKRGKKLCLRTIVENPEIVCYFPSGYDPSKVDPETGEKAHKPPNVAVYKHKHESEERVDILVSPPGSNVEYNGTNYSGEQAVSPTCRSAIGYLNEKAKTMRIIPVAYNKIIRLDDIVKIQEPEASGSGPGEGLTKISQDENKVFEEKFNKLDTNSDTLTSTSSIVARNIPPYDASATTASDAYPLQKIIKKGEWKFLKDIYQHLQQERGAAENSFNAYPVFVRNRLEKLRDIEDNTEKQTISAALSLLTHLVRFKELNSRASNELAKMHKIPEMIHRKLTKTFMDSASQWGISTEKIDLLISYVLVLTLHVDKFKTNPEDITKDLSVRTGGLRWYYEQLGCKFIREESGLFASLMVPFQFPKDMHKRKRHARTRKG